MKTSIKITEDAKPSIEAALSEVNGKAAPQECGSPIGQWRALKEKI